MTTPRPNTIRALAADLAAGRTTSVALTEAALERAQSHRAAGGAAYVSLDVPVSYTHLTLPTNTVTCRSRWSPYH